MDNENNFKNENLSAIDILYKSRKKIKGKYRRI